MLVPMKRGTALILAGAVALASAAYAIGTQVGGGSAAARDEEPERGPRFAPDERFGPGAGFGPGAHVGPGERFEPPEPFGDLADELGIDSDELRDALEDFRKQRLDGPRDGLAEALADALGRSTDEVEKAFEELRETAREESAERLARALGLDADEVEDALEKVTEDARADRMHRPGDFIDELAAELGVTPDRLEEGFRDLRPTRPHPPLGHRGAPFEGLERALDVTRAELRDAFREALEEKHKEQGGELAQFLAERFNLSVDEVEDALRETLPPRPHRMP
jgi:hypothetical protein